MFAARLRTRPDLHVVDAEPEDGPEVTLEEAGARLLEVAGDRIRVLIVDSLQTVPCEAARYIENPRERIDVVIATCKRLAKRGAIVIAISEMSRGGYRTGDRATDTAPIASGKESGNIEYGGALLLALYSVKGEQSLVDVVVTKNRIGSAKPTFRVRANAERATFCEVASPVASSPGTQLASERLDKAKERVREVLRTRHDCKSARAVLRHANGTAAHNLDALQDMIEQGEVVTIDGHLRLQVRTV
jgi:hypothetical protein